MNLLKETIDDIKESGHEPDNIVFIGSELTGHSCNWKEFKKLADNNYDDGFGSQKVATDLIIVFNDGAKMWRQEYDGSESWNYSAQFLMPEKTKPIYRLFAKGIGFESLAEINDQ